MDAAVEKCLDKLGYNTAGRGALHLNDRTPVPGNHPYAPEIKMLLSPKGEIKAHAVFDVERTPTVVFVGGKGKPLSSTNLDEVRKRIWNQNLATVVIDVHDDNIDAFPARKMEDAKKILRLADARPDGPFSATEVITSNLPRRLPEWFKAEERVDHVLLKNLSDTVKELAKKGFSETTPAKEQAELLMLQVLFISYLEHRGIVGQPYRKQRKVAELHGLVGQKDREGIRILIDWLQKDFNGDFLGADRHNPWDNLGDHGFSLLEDFLSHTDMETGQQSFWNYDFSFIPVELLSSLYEKLLAQEQQSKQGAYYTPRNLAVLAVEHAFTASPDPLRETIFDGACGSGILLTTAYRRLISLSEAKEERQLTFSERGDLLRKQIFGADVNPVAGKVTAFSLYLSLLEGFNPADIVAAQKRGGAKLPVLKDKNLFLGESKGNFFSPEHAFNDRRFSMVISNPPWVHPQGQEATSADNWAKRKGIRMPKRQIASAYALHARDFLTKNGHVCLMLPMATLLGTSAKQFVSRFLTEYSPISLINFGDLSELLFPTADKPCHVFCGRNRTGEQGTRESSPYDETFDYLIPKADLSLALGRLSMLSADRHTLQTRSVIENPQLLVTMMWGDANDLAIYTRLAFRGTIADLQSHYRIRTGVRFNSSKDSNLVNAEVLRESPYIETDALRKASPIFHKRLLNKWPESQKTVVNLKKDVLAVFDGPRVLFSGGFSSGDHHIRAAYYEHPATFSSSVSVIAGNKEDKALLMFLAVYLRSKLGRYFLMMHSWRMLCDINAVNLDNVKTFPFFTPENAPDRKAAEAALRMVSGYMAKLDSASLSEQKQRMWYENMYAELDEAVFDYFGLVESEKTLVRETVDVLMPLVRPRTIKKLNVLAQQNVSWGDVLNIYAKTLAESLSDWRDKMGGCGFFGVEVVASEPEQDGPSVIVRVDYSEHGALQTDVEIKDGVARQTLDYLRKAGLHIITFGNPLSLVPDVHLWLDGTFYLVRPLNRRSWTVRQALRDAEFIVRQVQSPQANNDSRVVS